jgi:hypothetical protein
MFEKLQSQIKIRYLKTKYKLYEIKYIIKVKLRQLSIFQLFIYSNWILLIWHFYGFVTGLMQGNIFLAGLYLLFAIINVMILHLLYKSKNIVGQFKKAYFSF